MARPRRSWSEEKISNFLFSDLLQAAPAIQFLILEVDAMTEESRIVTSTGPSKDDELRPECVDASVAMIRWTFIGAACCVCTACLSWIPFCCYAKKAERTSRSDMHN